jgi:UDP-N-acetylglucosamine 2-epimerase (non-hydrolysing)
MEAGNRCFDARVPEEINRRIIDHVADINMPYSDIAREYLVKEGLPPDQIIKTGSPMREVIEYYLPKIEASKILNTLKLQDQKYFVVSSHREENVDSPANLTKFVQLLNQVAERYQEPVVVSTHPRTRIRLEQLNIPVNPLIQFLKPFGFFDYVHLQMHAHCVLSDSGTISEESSILNFPALNLREAHERPEGFEEAAVMLVGLNPERVLQGIEIVKDQPRGQERLLNIVQSYAPQNLSDKILRIILSYTDFVQRKTWKNQV